MHRFEQPEGDSVVDSVRQIQVFNAGREPERLLMKYSAMRATPFGFLRGSCHLFYARLARSGVFKSAPLVWVCGDLHFENFGSYKGDNGLVYFDVSDFDESALAPASWDLVRFLTSLRIGADTLSVSSARAQLLCKAFVYAYGSALAQGKAFWVERDTAQGIVRELLDGLGGRQRSGFLDSRTTVKRHQRSIRVDGKRALPASKRQCSDVTNAVHTFAKSQPDPDFYSVLDVARRIAGTGSLGLARYVVLVNGKGSPDGNYLLDLKQVLPSSLVPQLKAPQPKWKSEAHRVVALQRRLQAVSMAFLQPVLLDETPFLLRALQPSEDRIAFDRSHRSTSELKQAAETMGRIVAWAHLRSAGRDGSAIADELVEFGPRKKWKEQLLGASQDCATQVRRDAAEFNTAWNDGAFARSPG